MVFSTFNQTLLIDSNKHSLAQWVKQWLVGKTSHYLPVVARGAVPSIYRRAAFPHRATPVSLPLHMSTVWIHVV